jgi:hypothetical protein
MDVVVEEEDMVVVGVDMLHLPLHSRMHVGMTMEEEAEEADMVIIVDVVVPDMEEDPDMEVVDMVVVDVVVVHPVAMR